MKRVLFFSLIVLFFAEPLFGQSDDGRKAKCLKYIQLALDTANAKDYEMGLVIIDSAMAIDSVSGDIIDLKAEFLWHNKRFYEAAIYYKRALLADTDSSKSFGAYFFLGLLYEKAGLFEEAKSQYTMAVYLFENKINRHERLFAPDKRVEYPLSVLLSGDLDKWNRLIKEDNYKIACEIYCGKSRQEIIERCFNLYGG